MKRDVLNYPRLSQLKKERRNAVRNKILILLLGLVAVFAFLSYVSRLSSINISSVEVSGNKIVDTASIQSVALEQIAGKYFLLFPKSNFLIYPENKIVLALQDKFKRLENINLSVSNKVLKISVTERGPSYTWCGADTNEEKCYFMDDTGYIFDAAPHFSGAVYFQFYGGGVGDETPTGSYFSRQNFKQLVGFRDTLLGMGLKPIALYVENNNDVDVFLSGGTTPTTGPKIIVKGDADFQNVAENLQAALNTEPLKSKFKNNYSALEYIDLRFGNKVYDKFR